MSSIKKLRSGTVPCKESGNSVLPTTNLPAWNFQNAAAPVSSMYDIMSNASHVSSQTRGTIKPH